MSKDRPSYASLVGRRLGGRYIVGEQMDEGGMGAVYRATDTERGDAVAIKVLHPDLAKETRHIARFFREAEAAMALRHPHIVETRSLSGPGDPIGWFAMELLEGASLHQWQDRGRTFTPAEVIRIGRQILSALTATHSVGVLHRDLKPGNVMLLDGQGTTVSKLVDFGIAVFTTSETYTRLTATGMILGTPAYMPPEQVCGDALDERTDIYSLAATLHTILVGEPPFGRGTWADILPRILSGARQPLEQRGVDRALAKVIETGLATDPDARWGNAREMELALGALDASNVRTIHEWERPALVLSMRLGPFDDTGPGFAPTMTAKVPGAFPSTRETPSSRPPPMVAALPNPTPSSRPMTPPDEEPINAYPTDEFRLPTRSRGPFLVALGVFSTVLLGAFVVLGSSEREVEVPVPAASSLPSALVPAPREDPPVVPAETPVPVGLDAPDIDADDHAHSGEVAPEAGDAPRGDAQRASRRARMRRDEVATAASITEVASADPAAPKEDDEEEVREAPLVSVAGAVMPSVRAGSHAPIMVNVVGGGMAVTTAAPSATSDVEHTEGTHGPMVAVRTHGR